ncbi:MAG: hypothetical protein PHR77_05310 [Kiritimatiellae bacterium]|nr:hypothetical protein [Kiritimatiellia bacterium]
MKQVTFIAAFLIVAARMSAGIDEAPKKFHEWSGSRTIPVHRIALSDENGENIVPQYKLSMPYSSRKTCGACHDYNKISRGWHFNYAEKDALKGRPGQPWIWYDEITGMQLPIAGRGWKNTWKPEELGLTPWNFVKTFGRNLPGGGLGDVEDGPDDPTARWNLSGKLEIDCLTCHSASPSQNHSEWVKQVARENFRWAATAAAGLGEVGGMASRMPSSWAVIQGPNLDDTQYAIAPFVTYDTRLFDRKKRTLIDIASKPQDRHCLFCHSVAADGKQRKDLDVDVHTRSGINCADCHRNGVDHMVNRGYEVEAVHRGDLSVASSSCRGCHLGVKGAKGVMAIGGRLGAPAPEHKGLPPVHFDKLACTTCHSGPWPSDKLVRVRTARANRLGITGVANWVTDLPYIVEPVFIKGEDGKIAPHRMTWPSFWGKIEGDKVKPLPPQESALAGTNIFDAPRVVADILNAMNIGDPTNGKPALVSGKKVFYSNVDNGLSLDNSKTSAEQTGIVIVKDGALVPLVPAFNPAAEQMDPNIQVRITDLLKALNACNGKPDGVPVMTVGDKLYQLDETASMKTGNLKDEVDLATVKSDFIKLPSKSVAWGWLKDKKFSPLAPDFVLRSVVATVGTSFTFTEEQVEMVLKALASGDKSGKMKFAYICSGKMFTLDQAGKLKVSDNAAAEPAAWPLAHEVRSAKQALGAKKCTDCHSVKAPFFFGKVKARGPMKTASVQVKQMFELQGQDASFHRLFGLSFLVRSMFKAVIFGAACLIAAILALYALLALNRVTKFLGSRENK